MSSTNFLIETVTITSVPTGNYLVETVTMTKKDHSPHHITNIKQWTRIDKRLISTTYEI